MSCYMYMHVACRYSCEQVYDVVADVDSYKLFLPWCQESRYVRRNKTKSIAKLNIGFPPLMESYTALVLSEHPRFIRVSLVLSEHPHFIRVILVLSEHPYFLV